MSAEPRQGGASYPPSALVASNSRDWVSALLSVSFLAGSTSWGVAVTSRDASDVPVVRALEGRHGADGAAGRIAERPPGFDLPPPRSLTPVPDFLPEVMPLPRPSGSAAARGVVPNGGAEADSPHRTVPAAGLGLTGADGGGSAGGTNSGKGVPLFASADAAEDRACAELGSMTRNAATQNGGGTQQVVCVPPRVPATQ